MKFSKLYDLIKESDESTKIDQDFVDKSEMLGKSMEVLKPTTAFDKNEINKGKNLIEDIVLSIKILKNHENFEGLAKAILKSFKMNHKILSAFQQREFRTLPKEMKAATEKINSLIKIVNNPKKRDDADYDKFLSEYEDAVKSRNDLELRKTNLMADINVLIDDNYESNEVYSNQLTNLIKYAASSILKKFNGNGDFNLSDKHVEILNKLVSEDPAVNPFMSFYNEKEDEYEDSKKRAFDATKESFYFTNTIESIFENLPLSAFIRMFAPTLNKATPENLKVKSAGSSDLITKLKDIKSEQQFEAIKSELLSYIENNVQSKITRDMLIRTINGPFIKRKGTDSSAVRVYKSLKADNPEIDKPITESFDDYYDRIMGRTHMNILEEDEFKIDIMEMASLMEESNSKCTGPTKKAHSSRKGKKWMKCAKQTDGSYKRIHWGEAGVRVTGKSGNTKRKKSFRARHKCSSAKPGTPNAAACDDW